MLKNFLFGIFFLAASVSAQNPTVKFKHLTMEDGLSQSSITCILKDSQGFMWFGTEDGLNKYDGTSFTVYQNVADQPSSISSSYILALLEAEDEFLWIGTKKGLDRYNLNSGKFTRFSIPQTESTNSYDTEVSAIHPHHSGKLLIGTSRGLYSFDPATEVFKLLSNNLTGEYVVSIVGDGMLQLWVQSTEKLYKLGWEGVGQAHIDFEKSIQSRYKNTMLLDSAFLWTGTINGLLQVDLNSYSAKTHTFFRPKDKLDTRNSVLALCEGAPGRIWLGSNGGGLIDFDKATGAFHALQNRSNDQYGLNSMSITHLFRDESDILWLGTYSGGINKYDPHQIQFKHYKQGTSLVGLSEKSVRAVLKDRDSELWVGTHGGGLNRINTNSGEVIVYAYDENNPLSLSSNTIRSLAEDSEGTIWIGTWQNGLNSFNKQSGSFKRHPVSEIGKDSLNPIPALLIDEDNNLWVGGAALWKVNPQTGQAETYFKEDCMISTLFLDSENHLWFGTFNKGLFVLDRLSKRVKQYLHDPQDTLSLSHNHITSIAEDQDGLLWIGTYGGGMNVLDTSRQYFKHLDTRSGLLNDVIYGVLIDPHNLVWFSSNAGLARIDPKNMSPEYYGVEYGVQGNEFNAGAFFKAGDGEFFFGGINGLNAFLPTAIPTFTASKKIVFTAFQLPDTKKSFLEHQSWHKNISRAEHITLPFNQNSFTLKFAELNYSNNLSNSYQYQLEGGEGAWQKLGKKREVTVGNLKNGEYRLTIRAEGDLLNQASIGITILPPIWRTSWAYVIYLVAILFFAALVYRYFKKNARIRKEFELKLAGWEDSQRATRPQGSLDSKLKLQAMPVLSVQEKFISRAVQIVEEHLGDSSFDVERFMDEMFMSRSQLHRKLKASTGYSTTKFIRHIRLKRAAELLEANAGSVSEIAYKVGFENVGYFSKCFRETFGVPPSQYTDS